MVSVVIGGRRSRIELHADTDSPDTPGLRRAHLNICVDDDHYDEAVDIGRAEADALRHVLDLAYPQVRSTSSPV